MVHLTLAWYVVELVVVRRRIEYHVSTDKLAWHTCRRIGAGRQMGVGIEGIYRDAHEVIYDEVLLVLDSD